MAIPPPGLTVYGDALGVLMLDTRFPRIPGDIGNATTWPFPVRYEIVSGASWQRVCYDPDDGLLDLFTEAARKLEQSGVRAITTSCGFLAMYQQELAASVSVPVITSSLLQVPLVARMLRPGELVGVLTGGVDPLTGELPLTDRHFTGVGWTLEDSPVVVHFMPASQALASLFSGNHVDASYDDLELAVVDAALDLLRANEKVRAIVVECTNYVPYSQAIRQRTRLPVFDIYTLVMQVWEGVHGTSFQGRF